MEELITAAMNLEDSLNKLKDTWDTTINALTTNSTSASSGAFSGLSASLDSFMKKLGEIPGSLLANYNTENRGGFDRTVTILS